MKKSLLILFSLVVFLGLIFLIYKITGGLGQKTSVGDRDRSFINIQKKRRIIVGTNGGIPTMSFHDNSGNLVGLDIDIAKSLAAHLNVAVEFKEATFPNLFSAVQSGDVDILVSSITITPERSKVMLFSIPYFSAGQVMITLREVSGINQLEDLQNKKIGVLKGTTGEKIALQIFSRESVIGFDDAESRNEALKNKTIDAAIEDLTGAVGLVKKDPSFKTIGDPFTDEYYGIVTKLDNGALMDRINGILRDMKRSGELKTLIDKWIK